MPKKDMKKAVAKAILDQVTESKPRAIQAKKHKKKKTSFGSILQGAAKVAATLAPAVLPMLLAPNGHAASLAAHQAAGGTVGVAAGASIQPLTGLTSFKPIKTGDKVTGVTVTGMEYVGSVPALNPAGQPWREGDLVMELPLNPLSNEWDGTRIFTNAHLYERWRPRKMSVIYQPASATTVSGQFIGYIDPDPAEPLSAAGREAVQVASSHAGAEMNQPWQMGCAAYVYDSKTQDFYLDVEGDDIRLVSGGNFRLLAATDLGSASISTYGDVFVAYELDLKIPDRANTNALGGGSATYTSNYSTAVGTLARGTSFNGAFAGDMGDVDMYGSMVSRTGFERFDCADPASPTAWGPRLSPGSYVLTGACGIAAGDMAAITGTAPSSGNSLCCLLTEEGSASGGCDTSTWANVRFSTAPLLIGGPDNALDKFQDGGVSSGYVWSCFATVLNTCHVTPIMRGGAGSGVTPVTGQNCRFTVIKVDGGWPGLYEPMSAVRRDAMMAAVRERQMEARIKSLETLVKKMGAVSVTLGSETLTLGSDQCSPMIENHTCTSCGVVPSSPVKTCPNCGARHDSC